MISVSEENDIGKQNDICNRPLSIEHNISTGSFPENPIPQMLTNRQRPKMTITNKCARSKKKVFYRGHPIYKHWKQDIIVSISGMMTYLTNAISYTEIYKAMLMQTSALSYSAATLHFQQSLLNIDDDLDEERNC